MIQIAIMVENSRAYGRTLIEGIAAYAQEHCRWTLRPLTAEDARTQNLRRYDGIIARLTDEHLARRIADSRRPAVDVFCQKPHAGLVGVDSNHREIGRLARRFFVSRGFTNFAYCGFPGTTFSDAREQAFSDASTAVYAPHRRLLPDASQLYDERIDRIQDARSLARWLKTLPKPIAVFCCNDLRAIQLQRMAIDSGFRVPEDISILGVDNDTIACSFAEVPISSINPNSFEIGKAAARILSAMLAQRPPVKLRRIHTVKPGDITERASTEFMPVDPPWLGQVLLHIETNMRRPISAAEIFALAGRSSTFVEKVFKEKLGLSVQAYVTSVKMREAKRLLSDPHLRISEIGYACGFPSPQYFCRTFTATFGQSPKKFRA